MSVLAVIPARGGSKEIKGKNLKKINNKTLIEQTIDEAKKSKIIDKIYVSSDSSEILKLAKKKKIFYIKRPKNLSKDNSKTIDAIKHLLYFLKIKKNYIPNYVVILQPTSPFRKSYHIDLALKKILNDKIADSLVSCVEVPHNFTPELLMTKKKDGYLKVKKLFNRQKKKLYFARNGAAIYIIKHPVFYKNVFGKNVLPFLMDFKSSIDVNTLEDLKLARIISKYEKK